MALGQGSQLKTKDRFDLTFLQRLSRDPNIKQTYESLRWNWRNDEECKYQSLNHIQDAIKVSKSTEDQAIQACLDFHFERFFLPTMSPKQADAYLRSIEHSLHFPEKLNISSGKPLLVEMSHHQSIFSIAYSLVQRLQNEHDYQQVIMLHQQQELDPRIQLQQQLLTQLYGLDVKLIQLDSKSTWYRTIKSTLTFDTVILYFGDMAPNLFSDKTVNIKPQSLELVDNDKSFSVNRLSIADKMSTKLGAEHLFCNINHSNHIEISAASKHVLTCPIENWVFWPALGSLYDLK